MSVQPCMYVCKCICLSTCPSIHPFMHACGRILLLFPDWLSTHPLVFRPHTTCCPPVCMRTCTCMSFCHSPPAYERSGLSRCVSVGSRAFLQRLTGLQPIVTYIPTYCFCLTVCSVVCPCLFVRESVRCASLCLSFSFLVSTFSHFLVV